MKKYFSYLGILLSIVVVSSIVLQKVYYNHFTTHPPKNKLEEMIRLTDTYYDIIFVGSSRVERHVDCEIITKLTGKSCANFGYSGLELMDIDVLFSFFEKNNVTYDNAFVQVDYSYARRKHSANFKAAIVPYMNWDVVQKSLATSSENNTHLSLPFTGFITNDVRYNLREIGVNLFTEKPKEDFNYSVASLDGENTRVLRNFPSKYTGKHHSLERLIHSEKFKAGNLHFFISPYCPIVPNRNYHTQLANEYPFITDYTALFDDKIEMYRDCGHLNKSGAALFTNHIVLDLLSKQ
ncbi:hypothetical protein [Dokdonia sp.]|uniref:hypothetical protein n=1 Tax=Dokdonia sp. TaxID=2024995 RepID=UPI003264A06A